MVSVRGGIPSEVWNRVGTKLLPKVKSGHSAFKLDVGVSVEVRADVAQALRADLTQLITELGLSDRLTIEGG